MSVFVELLAPLTPELVWGLFPRVMGLVQLLAFAGMLPQVRALAGERGIAPLGERLQRFAQDFPGLRGMAYSPTLFWFLRGDLWLFVVPLLGMFGACLAIYGGDLGFWGALLAWVCLLSMDVVVNLGFPWDMGLLEASFLALLLPTIKPLPELEVVALPLPLVGFAWRLFVVRLMWGFAKTKFVGASLRDTLYLKYFGVWMPLPTPLGWWMHHAPKWFAWQAYAFMFVVEVVCPLLVFFPGTPRLIGFAGLAALMLGIQATGNWGYFNLGYIGFCFCLLDLQGSVADVATLSLAAQATPAGVTAAVLVLLGLIYFPFNCWVSQTWVHWSWDDLTFKRPLLRGFFALLRWLQPWRITAAYGVFVPRSLAPVKLVPVLEGSDDGEHWHAYEYRYAPTTEHSRPGFVAPYHPRLDQACQYAAYGFNEATLITSLSGTGKPHTFAHSSLFDALGQRLLEGSEPVLRLFANNPFPDAPPKYIRVTTYSFHATTPEERRRTGRYWRREFCSVHHPATGHDPSRMGHAMAFPECFHPDYLQWRRRCEPLRQVLAAVQAGEPLDRAVCAGSDLTAQEVSQLWEEVVPAAQACAADWDRLPALFAGLRDRYGEAQLFRFERLVERYAFVLRQRLEPHFFGKQAPVIELSSPFRFHLFLQELVFKGRRTYDELLEHPERASSHAEGSTDASVLFPMGLLRHRMMVFQVRCLHIMDAISDNPDVPVSALEFFPFLRTVLPDPTQRLPACRRLDNGEWRVSSMETTPSDPAVEQPVTG